MTSPSGGPVFVLGCGRSGTTLMRTMLNRHPAFAIPGETWFFPELDARKHEIVGDPDNCRDEVARFITTFDTFGELGVEPEAVRTVLAGLDRGDWPGAVAAANRAYADGAGAPRWGDKTPGYVRCLPLLHRLYPEAAVIHMIRDPRDVAVSFLGMPFGPTTPLRAAQWWVSDVQDGRTHGPSLFGDRYMEVHYEALVEDPEQLVRDVCRVVGEPFDPVMLDQKRREETQTLKEHWWHEQTNRPVTKSRMGRWKSEMRPRDVQVIEQEAGELMDVLGYVRSGAAGLGARVAWLAGRCELAVRRKLGPMKRRLLRQPEPRTPGRSHG